MDASVLNYTVNDNVASFLNKNQKLYIDGSWVDTGSSKTFDVEDPATGKKLTSCAAGNSKDIDLAVKAARNAFDSGKWTGIPANERGKIIWKIGDLIDQFHLGKHILVDKMKISDKKFYSIPVRVAVIDKNNKVVNILEIITYVQKWI